MRDISKLLSIAFLVLGSASAAARPYLVVGVSDGDTIKVLDAEKHQLTCRLYGIDAPEKKQAYGEVSKKALSALIYNLSMFTQPDGF